MAGTKKSLREPREARCFQQDSHSPSQGWAESAPVRETEGKDLDPGTASETGHWVQKEFQATVPTHVPSGSRAGNTSLPGSGKLLDASSGQLT